MLTLSGIFLGFAANVIVKDTGPISWRLQLGSAFIPSFILMCGIWFCPESPRWLMKKARYAEGFKAMSKIRAHDIIAARDFYYSYVLYCEELRVGGGMGYFSRLADCFRIPRIRRANYGASTVMLAQQMCGINSTSNPFGTTPLTVQLSPSTVPQSSATWATIQHKHYTHRWATVLYKSSPQFPPYS